MKLRRAAASGVRVMRIETGGENDPETNTGSGTRIKSEEIQIANNLKFLDEIETALRGGEASANAARIAKELRESKKAMIVFQRNVLTKEAAARLCRIALLSGHEGEPRDGVLEVLPKCNSRGLYDLEIRATPEDILNNGYGADVKALIVFGEDPAGQIAAAGKAEELPDELKAAKELLGQIKFLAVCDTHMTATAEIADVVIPTPGFVSSDGTYTNTEGRLLVVSPATGTPTNYSNWQICREIAKIAGSAVDWESETDLSRELNDVSPVPISCASPAVAGSDTFAC
jgi:formate dehydrogenase major subunit